MARQRLDPGLDAMLLFTDVGINIAKGRRRQGGGRRHRLRRFVGNKAGRGHGCCAG